MYIGCLNNKCNQLDYQIYKKNTLNQVKMQSGGNPFQRETLHISWKELLETGVDIHVQMEEGYFLNEVVLYFGEKSKPTSVKLYTKDKKKELYCYCAETGRTIGKKMIVLPIDSKENEFVVEINVSFSDVILEGMEVYGAELSEVNFLPIPNVCVFSEEEKLTASMFRTYSCYSDIGKGAGGILKEKFKEFTGVELLQEEHGNIELLLNSEVVTNGYHLDIDAKGARIEASDLRGMTYGVEVFLKMISQGMLCKCTIKDAPRMPFRGVHMPIPHPSQFDFAKRLVKYVLSPMGYNCIIMEIGGAMEFESHPEINRAVEEAYAKGKSGEWPPFPHGEAGCGATVKKEQLCDFVAYCRAFGIDVVPEIQSLGHVQFMTVAHPDIAERPEKEEVKEEIDGKDADIPPNEFYGHSYCPSNPKSYEILFDLIDEIVDVFTPKEYVHMGHDEVYQIGVCPKCKDKDPADLLAEDVNRIHDYLAKKGLKMMLWADMFQPVTKYKTSAALDMIPEDILLWDFVWYFHMSKDIEDNLLTKNRKVVLANMYSSHYPRYESRVIKEGVVGAQISGWVPTTERDLSREGKLYDFVYAAQMMWSADYTSHARYSYDNIIKTMMPSLRAKLKDVQYPSMMENAKEMVVVDHGMYQPGQACKNEVYEIHRKAESVIFEHTATDKLTRIPWIELDEIGAYEVSYTDGTKAKIPITYAGNISHWNRRQNEPFTAGYYRHTGYQSVSYETDSVETRTAEYGYVTMYRYEWINPFLDKTIEKIEYVKGQNAETDVYVGRIVFIG